MAIHPAKEAQIALLVTEKVKILTKYSDFSDIFLEKQTSILLKTIKLNQYAIELYEGQQLPYELIYSLGLVKLKTLKTYIETNFFNNFIRTLKLPAGAFIFFVWKPDGRLRLCIDYWSQ